MDVMGREEGGKEGGGRDGGRGIENWRGSARVRRAFFGVGQWQNLVAVEMDGFSPHTHGAARSQPCRTLAARLVRVPLADRCSSAHERANCCTNCWQLPPSSRPAPAVLSMPAHGPRGPYQACPLRPLPPRTSFFVDRSCQSSRHINLRASIRAAVLPHFDRSSHLETLPISPPRRRVALCVLCLPTPHPPA